MFSLFLLVFEVDWMVKLKTKIRIIERYSFTITFFSTSIFSKLLIILSLFCPRTLVFPFLTHRGGHICSALCRALCFSYARRSPMLGSMLPLCACIGAVHVVRA